MLLINYCIIYLYYKYKPAFAHPCITQRNTEEGVIKKPSLKGGSLEFGERACVVFCSDEHARSTLFTSLVVDHHYKRPGWIGGFIK